MGCPSSPFALTQEVPVWKGLARPLRASRGRALWHWLRRLPLGDWRLAREALRASVGWHWLRRLPLGHWPLAREVLRARALCRSRRPLPLGRRALLAIPAAFRRSGTAR